MTIAAPSGPMFFRRPRAIRCRSYLARFSSLFAYLVFGGIAALANLAAGWLLYGAGAVPGLPYWCATAIAAAIGMATNFYLNHTFNFRFRGRPALHQFGTFFAVSLVGIALTSGISSALRALLLAACAGHLPFGVNAGFVAHVAAVALVVLYSYPAHRGLSFNVGIRRRLHQLGL